MKRWSTRLALGSLLVGPVLLWALLRSLDVSFLAVLGRLDELSPGALILLATALVMHIALAGEKWRLVESQMTARPPGRGEAATFSAIGTAAGQFLPPLIANAAVRAAGARWALRGSARRGAFSSIWEQLFDLGVVILLCPAALTALHFGRPEIFVPAAVALAAAGDRTTPWIVSAAGRRLGVSPLLLDAVLSRRLYRISVLRYGLLTIITCAAAQAAASAIAPTAIAASIPLVAFAAMASLLPAGLGVNEWSFVQSLGAFGVSPAAALQFALINRMLVASTSLAIGAAAVLILPRGVSRAGPGKVAASGA